MNLTNLKYPRIERKCIDCGTTFTVSSRTIQRNPKDHPWRCPKCSAKHAGALNKQHHENRTPEEKEKIKQKKQKWWNNLPEEEKKEQNKKKVAWYTNKTPEEKAAHNKKKSDDYYARPEEEKQGWVERGLQSWENRPDEEKKEQSERTKRLWQDPNYRNSIIESQKRGWANKSEEEMRAWSERCSAQSTLFWETITDEKRAEMSHKQSVIRKEWWENITDEERMIRSQKQSEWYQNLPDSEKQKYADRPRERWNNMSPEEYELEGRKISERQRKRWENAPLEERQKYSECTRKQWDSYPDTEEERLDLCQKLGYTNVPRYSKESYTKLRLKGNRRNKLNITFEKLFNIYKLSDHFVYIDEFVTSNNGIFHSWDYGIFDENGELVMVVDLDGAFYHADDYDYNGIHSREEYDEQRFLLIPDRTHHFILYEKRIRDDFQEMLKILINGYDEYIENTFRTFRAMPFPEPKYADFILVRSYSYLQQMKCNDKYHKNLSLNCRQGDILFYHFHPSIWQQRMPGKISPYDAWYDDRILKEMIRNHQFLHDHRNKNKILQAFNLSDIAPKIQFMSGGKSKMIIHRYLNEYDTIFDPFAGLGNRLLGATSLGKKYIGLIEPDILYRETMNMVEFLRIYFEMNVTLLHTKPDRREYPCLFTAVDNDNELDYCLNTYKCQRYVFIMKETKCYQNNIADVIIDKSLRRNDQQVIVI